MSVDSVRNLLAYAGVGMNDIDGSFNESARGGDSFGFRATARNIKNVDDRIKRHFGIGQQYDEPAYNLPNYQMENTSFMNFNPVQFEQKEPKMSREDRINKLLGRTVQQKPQVISDDRSILITKAVQEAIEPISESLEDMSILLGLVVQRLEQLIKVVDPESYTEDTIEHQQNTNTFQGEEEIPEPMEVYTPEVSMSVTDDEENTPPPSRKKKKNKQ